MSKDERTIPLTKDGELKLVVDNEREEIRYVNATPDPGYPVRILKAHLEGATSSRVVGHGGTAEEMAKSMSRASEERAKYLREAIEILEREM